MTDTERQDAAMRWLARNVTWSHRLDAHRAAPSHAPVVFRFTRIDHEARPERRHDRVA